MATLSHLFYGNLTSQENLCFRQMFLSRVYGLYWIREMTRDPVASFSKKLLRCEEKYSTMEKECWGLQAFQPTYLGNSPWKQIIEHWSD